jgi:hypothetical protein
MGALSGRVVQSLRSHALTLQPRVEFGTVDIDPSTDLDQRRLQSIRFRMEYSPTQRGFRDERCFHRYLLHGRQVPKINHGKPHGVRGRIECHDTGKDFRDWGAVFVPNSGGLKRAHVTCLEYALVKRATEAKRYHLDNGNSPQEGAVRRKLTCFR